MAQIAKMETQVEIKSSADSFFQTLRDKQSLLPKLCPQIVKSVKLIEGDWESVGSVKEWVYVAGDAETCKEMVEAIDEPNKSITFTITEGAILKYYKSMKTKVQVSAKGETGGGVVTWTLEYEKQNDDVPSPTKYLETFPALTESFDDYAYRTNKVIRHEYDHA